MDYAQVKEYLNSFVNYEHTGLPDAAAMNLDRVRGLLDSLGNPQERYRSIHIAGTKGKGSTCAFIFSILRDAAYKVGLYTSPHLVDFRERIKVGYVDAQNEPKERYISEAEVCELVSDLRPYLDKIERLTFFEVMTVLAFKFFAVQGCDFAVVETGMGGTWDATNVITPMVSGLTSISFDHTRILGETLEQIAAAKAGIIKEGGLVVSAPQPIKAWRVITQVCQERRARLYEVGRDFVFDVIGQDIERSLFDFRGVHGTYEQLQIKLLGFHQLVNAAVALGVIQLLKLHDVLISPMAVRRGLERTLWPGRLQIMQRHPFVILDGAHNPAAAEALRTALAMLLLPKRSILILGVSRDKDAVGICAQLCRQKNLVIVTQAKTPRAMPVQELEAVVRRFHHQVQVAPTIEDALQIARQDIGPEDVILIAGSLYLVGETFAALRTVKMPRNMP